MSETEKELAIKIANRALDVSYADPDDDLRTIARQFLRAVGTEQAYHARGAGALIAPIEALIEYHEKYAKSHVSSKWIYGENMMVVQAYKKVLQMIEAQSEPGADTGTTPPPFSEVINAWQAANHATGSLADMLDSLKEFASAYRAATQRAPVEQVQPAVANIDLPRNEFEAAWAHYASTAPGTATEKNVFMAGWNAAAPDHAREGALLEALELAKGALANGSTIDQRYETYKIVCAALADGKEGGE